MRSPDLTLDLVGLKCPLPALKTAKALKGLGAGTQLRVRCSDPLSVIDIPNLINETGDRLTGQSREGETLIFDIVKA